jgi:hypothetical protein
MGIQYFMPLSGEKLASRFLATDGSRTGKIHTFLGYREQPDQDFLIFVQ